MPARPATANPEAWLADHGDYLFRYALLQLRNEAAAEDAVQETLLAALGAWERFSGQSSVRTWLTGILKHKILDSFRRQAREPSFSAHTDDPETELAMLEQALFDATGHWASPVQTWGDPESSLEQQRFWEAFIACLEALSPVQARVFHLRELDGFSTEAICKELNISSTNCWVMLHRARLGLQQCLEARWGGRSA